MTQYNKQVLTKKQLQETQLKKLALFRAHTVLRGESIQFNSELIVFCSADKLITKTTYHNSKRNKFGCLKCAREKQSKVVTVANCLRKK